MLSSSTELACATRPIRVFLAEDHAITLWGLRRLLESPGSGMEVVGTASRCAELLGHPAMPSADVLVLDLDLAGQASSDCLPALRRLCAGRVLVLTGSDEADKHRAAVLKGVRGVVHKSAPADMILRAIEKVHDGEIWLDQSLLGDVLTRLTDGPAPAAAAPDPEQRRIASLTPREREIVATMLSRSGAKQLSVADELHMSEHTLRNHLTTIYSKLGVHGRLELHVYGTKHGLAAPAG